ncbi:MAG: peptidase M14 [Acidobacteria bacterium]|nr:peptidase M14 [Acidobacteriota bacterium]
MVSRWAVAALLLLVSAAARGQAPFWPGVTYDPAVPAIGRTLGYAPGERISWHGSIVRYFETLAAAQPARMKVWEYGKTWEGRKLIFAAIGSEANIRLLNQIKANQRKIADPRTTPEAEAAKLMAAMPAVIWLGYGVHGNEISSPDAAMLTAYHLLATRRDPVVDRILANVVVLIDPLQNPDGRDRFVHHFEMSEGLEAQAEPSALEHDEPWLSGRTNHYHFDMNRDWITLTQPETRGRVKTLLEWLPLVFVDLHEMGSNSTYYFAPEAVPYNPHLTAAQRTSLDWFGKNNARWFDQYGFSYFTREVYDAFYPGYGASWPAYYGAIAMTYEQASARGLRMRRTDEREFTFRDTVRQHFVASISTAETAARERPQLLANFRAYRVSAIEEGSREAIREYVLPRRGDVSAVDKLAHVLAAQGIEVHRAAQPAGGFPAGSYFIRLNQPQKRMVRTLLDAKVEMEKDFLAEQERRRKKKLPDEIYDITGWALPLVYNVEALPRESVTAGTMDLITPGALPTGSVTGKGTVAYLVPWGTQAAARFLTAALRAGLRLHTNDKGFKQNGRAFPRGTLIVKTLENSPGLDAKIAALAAAQGAEVIGTETGWVEDGVNFGSRFVHTVKAPVVAIAWDSPASSASAGHTRFVLERQYGYPAIPVRAATLASADLSRFDVIVLPDGAYSASLMTRLKDWVRAGGTLIGVGGAVSSMADAKTGLLAIQRETLPKPEKSAEKKAGDDGRVPGTFLVSDADYDKAITPEGAMPDDVAGVLVAARTDPDHWLTAGLPAKLHAMISGRNVFTPVKIDKGTNAAVMMGPADILAAGYLWEENRKLLAHKPLAVVQREGRGWAIGFTADPNYRALMDGLNLLFLNAVFGGPAHAR